MVVCKVCGRERGFWGQFTWRRCGECDSTYCPSCFHDLREVQEADGPWAKICAECESRIRLPSEVEGYFPP